MWNMANPERFLPAHVLLDLCEYNPYEHCNRVRPVLNAPRSVSAKFLSHHASDELLICFLLQAEQARIAS